MKKIKLFIAALVLFFLAGCATNPTVVVKNVVIAPPDNYLVNCKVEPPPNYKRYFIADWEGKEELLFTAFDRQTDNVITCNDRLGSLRAWKVDQLKLYQQ